MFNNNSNDSNNNSFPFFFIYLLFIHYKRYALERHVKQYEVLYSKEPILGYIRKEPIYPRRNVRPVSTEGHWIREGLQLKKGEKPLKYAKSKAYMLRQFRLEYLIKKHAALPKDFELGEEMVPLYGKWQTEKYKPKPVVNVNYDYDDYDYNFFFLYIYNIYNMYIMYVCLFNNL